MFTASLPPSIVASVRASLARLRAHPEIMDKLWSNVDTLYGTLQAAGFRRLRNLRGGILAWAREVDPSLTTY